MSEWVQVVVVAIPALSAVACELIKRLPPRSPGDSRSRINRKSNNSPDEQANRKRSDRWRAARNLCLVFFLATAAIVVALAFCQRSTAGAKNHETPVSVTITVSPQFGDGGPEVTQPIAGKVSGHLPDGARVVIYVLTDHWYVEPSSKSPFTTIRPDGTWNNDTHLGKEYVVLVVGPTFRPPSIVDSAPGNGEDVVSITHVTAEQK
jgi:hypothetical protein